MKSGSIGKRREGGFTIMEMIIGLTVGLVLLVGLVASFASGQRAQREMTKDAEQIENGRMAIEVLSKDISLAGYFHNMYQLPSLLAVPDPCAVATGAAGLAALLDATGIPAHSYEAPDPDTIPALPSSCAALLPASNLMPGSDVIVIRRAGTMLMGSADDPVSGELYVQTGAFQGEIQLGVSGADLTPTALLRADGSSAAATATRPEMRLRDEAGVLIRGPIAPYILRIYFVAPCSEGTGAGGVCQAGDGNVPTLKRLDIAGGALAITPMVEGVQAMAVEWGVDDFPATVSEHTGFIGDGQPDSWARGGLSAADWGNVTGARIFVLARNTAGQPGHVDSKTYEMGLAGTYPSAGTFSDGFRRHVYSTAMRVENQSKRRERP